jgi:parallel beta-helix repeat protein
MRKIYYALFFLVLLMPVVYSGEIIENEVSDTSAVSCGDIITTDTILTENLVCSGAPLTVTNGATLNCNGFSIMQKYYSQGYDGIEVYNGSTIKNCIIGEFDMGIKSYGGNNIINNNTIFGQGVIEQYTGIYLASSNNLVTNNKIYNYTGAGMEGSGIVIWGSYDNIIKNNLITLNRRGLLINYGQRNLIYNNYFESKVIDAEDVLGGNYWNITKTPGKNIIHGPFIAGNFWMGYKGEDLDGDRIGDTQIPYTSGGNGVEDYLPLTLLCGDNNNDGTVTSSDIIILVNYVFRGLEPSVIFRTGDVDGNSLINSADIIYLVNYVFKGGPAPVC